MNPKNWICWGPPRLHTVSNFTLDAQKTIGQKLIRQKTHSEKMYHPLTKPITIPIGVITLLVWYLCPLSTPKYYPRECFSSVVTEFGLGSPPDSREVPVPLENFLLSLQTSHCYIVGEKKVNQNAIKGPTLNLMKIAIPNYMIRTNPKRLLSPYSYPG